jgi:cell division protease FtsH
VPNPGRPRPRPTAPRVELTLPVVIAATALLAVLAAGVGFVAVGLAARGPVDIGLSELGQRLEAGEVAALTLLDRRQVAEVELVDGTSARASYPSEYGATLVDAALAADVAVEVTGSGTQSPAAVATRVGALALAGLLLLLVLRHRMGGGALPGGRHRATEPPSTRFGDIAGAEEITAELREVVEYLVEPDRFAHLGARAPKGVLLVGPPGTGKTLLARAVAGEAGVPFFALSGADFVEKFVGVGASRVRNVFASARKAGRAIIFIDELDAVGKRRGGGLNSNDEREQTLNQLLVEMDGFASSEIVVLAATNRPDTLDTALTRPGRFDRQVTVGAPDRGAREAILRLHLADRPVGEVDLAALSRRMPGFTGADIANLVNQGALAAARDGAATIEQRHLDAAIATVMLGPERRSIEVMQRDREITAWHEAGHTVAAMLEVHAMDPAGVSIVPRGHAGGVTWMSGDDHQFLLAPQARAQLVVAMAGRAAEELIYGAAYTQGASGDLRHATDLATRMAAEWGMSDVVGPVHIAEDDRHAGETADLLRRAVRELLVAALDEARTLVAGNRDLLTAVADALLEAESLDTAELRELRARFDGVLSA